MVTGLEIKDLIQSQEYKDLLNKAKDKYEISVYDDDDSILQECSSVADEVNKSGLEIVLISNFMNENHELVLNFSKTKISGLSSDYSDFEEDGDEDNDVVLLGQSKAFLITNSIEMLLMQKSEEHLIRFLKMIRTPSCKKYAKELIAFYEDSCKSL